MQKKLTLPILLILLFVTNTVFAQNLDNNTKRYPKIGLVLSGGGANGFAHIGVLKVLEEQGIRPDYITGTSMGSIVGALYSMGYSAEQLEEIVSEADWNQLFSDKISFREIPILDKDDYPGYSLKMSFNNGIKPSLPSGMIQGQQIQALFAKLVWQSNLYPDFDAFPIPYRCVATDIISGKAYIFKEGNLAEAMRTSMSIPTVFAPMEKDSMLLVDGGVIKNFPVQECIDMGADIIIGVYTGFNENPQKDDLKSMVKILARTSAFPGIIHSKEQAKKTDVYIAPNLNEFGPDNFNKAKSIIDAGEIAARDSLTILKLQEIASSCKRDVDSLKTLHNKKSLWIDRIQVEGCHLTDEKTIINISGLKTKRCLSAQDIDEATKKIYSTWQFKKVSYEIDKKPKERILVFVVEEKSRATLDIGLHYDNSFGPNAHIKASYNNLLFKSTKASIKLALSRNPRTLLKYRFYPFKRRGVEIALNTYLQLNKMPDIIKEEKLIYTLGHYVYTFADFNLSLSWSPVKNMMLQASSGKQLNNIVLKEGMEIYYNTNTVNYNYSFYQFHLFINTLDDPFFPTKGIFLDAKYKYQFNTNTNQSDTSYLNKKQTNDNEIFTLNYRQYIRIGRLSIIPELCVRTMSEDTFITEKFFLGGINYSLRPNTFSFGGIRANYLATDNFAMLGIGGQFKIRKNWYLQAGLQNLIIADNADYESEDEEPVFSDNYFVSWRAGVGYQSKFGPIRFILSKSPERKEFVWSMNIGVPF